MKSLLQVTGLQLQRSPNYCLTVPKLKVQGGSLLCITGPNGCGKTSLLECLVGLLVPQEGSIILNGRLVSKNLRSTKASFGYAPDTEDWFIKELCAREYFSLLERVYRDAGVTTNMQARVQELAGQLLFTAFLQPLGSLSHGNKKKVQIIAALMHCPPVIIVDEIRNGLDPLAILAVEDLLQAELKRGAALIAATHDLWWAQRLSDQTLLLIDGSVAAYRKTLDLIDTHGSLEQFFVRAVKKRVLCPST